MGTCSNVITLQPELAGQCSPELMQQSEKLCLALWRQMTPLTRPVKPVHQVRCPNARQPGTLPVAFREEQSMSDSSPRSSFPAPRPTGCPFELSPERADYLRVKTNNQLKAIPTWKPSRWTKYQTLSRGPLYTRRLPSHAGADLSGAWCPKPTGYPDQPRRRKRAILSARYSSYRFVDVWNSAIFPLMICPVDPQPRSTGRGARNST
jgi:hypothetical protein